MSRVDVVLFGASGFTGKHATEQLARLAAQRGLTWAVAGRSREKLMKLLHEVSYKTGLDVSSTPVLVADVQDEPSVSNMCARARVLASCCGPYTLYGEVVVKACILNGTHYVDVTAEPNFIEMTRLKYGVEARAARVFVVSACAWESIPSDMGVVFVQQNFGGVLNSVECYMSSDAQTGSYNYGTWKSLVYSMPHLNEIPAIKKKLYPKPLPKFTPELKSRFPIHKRLNGWCVPFVGNAPASVYHTQRYFYEKHGTRPAQIKTYSRFRSFWFAIAVVFISFFIYIMSQLEVTRKILLNNWRIFSLGSITKGPTEKATKDVAFGFDFFCNGWDKSVEDKIDTLPPNKIVVAKVSGTNAGYGMSVLGLLYSAVAILEEPHNMPPEGGVLTPGIAFAKTNLVKNLRENGVNFEIIYSKIKKNDHKL